MDTADSLADGNDQAALISAIETRLIRYLRRAQRHSDYDLYVDEVITDIRLAAADGIPLGALWEIAVSHLRRLIAADARLRRRLLSCDMTHLPADDAADLEIAYRIALWNWEEHALSHLTGLQRAALERYEMDGVDDENIARETGCAQASLRVLRHKAKARIRTLVRSGVIPPPPSQ